ncbi:Por secretion system protein [Prevotella copri]|jgi:ligand-binding sensor domain-containing protein|uniref:type IX secretion system anionic LPS delivery protein PorZ n=1 Tax=Segatella copri TaxID=165179 RepID=UPI001932A8EA|nr:two-component regulator propeller domain-containing protein [Segatella copri]MBM0263871.1 Por secretion system protein [Segatella copri]
MKTITLLITILFMVLPLSATDKESWEIYTSYNDITEIEPAGNLVFALASNGLFSYHIKDGSVTTYDKANTLSDFDINHIAWNKTTKKLVITYTNGNIDLLDTNGNVVNVPDLYLKSMTDNKQINHIYISGTNVYLSLSFGIIKLDTKEGKILDTYKLGFNVNYSYIEDNCLYAASKEAGLYKGVLKNNLLDNNNWEKAGNFKEQTINSTNVYDTTNKYWWTVKEGKLTYYTLNTDKEKIYQTEGIIPDGPASNKFYRLYINKNKLYAVAGAWSQEKDCNNMGEVHVWNGEKWEEFEQPSDASLGHLYRDLLYLDFDPSKEGHIMVGSKAGLYEFQDGKFIKCYNKDNTSVITSPLGNNYTIISSVKYDARGKLWLLNSLGDNSILSFDQTTQEWKHYPHSEIGSNDRYNLTGLIIGKNNGNIWFVNNYYEKNRLYKYNYNTDELTMYGPTFTNEDGRDITPIYVHCLAEDRNGNIWIGTTSGPLYLSMSDIKNGNNIFTQHKVPRNDNTNYADYLLDNSNIRCIAVDGANQKWFGTDNGVYLVSDDCNTQIYHFDTDNSPLISNIVYSIAVNNNTGKVYFATDKGLCSFNNGIVGSNSEMTKDNVYAYPNPVKPDYTGKINIVGLSFNANIKIVSTNGTLINEGRSAGGSYSWDGCDLNGKKVASGIYMVETATESGEKGIVCKIAIIR